MNVNNIRKVPTAVLPRNFRCGKQWASRQSTRPGARCPWLGLRNARLQDSSVAKLDNGAKAENNCIWVRCGPWQISPDKSRRVMDGGLFKSSKSTEEVFHVGKTTEEVFLFTLENKRGGFTFPPCACFQASNCGHWQEERSGDWKATTATHDRRGTKRYCQMYGGFKHLFGQLKCEWLRVDWEQARANAWMIRVFSQPARSDICPTLSSYLYRTQGTSAVLSLHSTYFCSPVAYPNICHQNQCYKHEHWK
jgi:hypothetical protein